MTVWSSLPDWVLWMLTEEAGQQGAGPTFPQAQRRGLVPGAGGSRQEGASGHQTSGIHPQPKRDISGLLHTGTDWEVSETCNILRICRTSLIQQHDTNIALCAAGVFTLFIWWATVTSAWTSNTTSTWMSSLPASLPRSTLRSLTAWAAKNESDLLPSHPKTGQLFLGRCYEEMSKGVAAWGCGDQSDLER